MTTRTFRRAATACFAMAMIATAPLMGIAPTSATVAAIECVATWTWEFGYRSATITASGPVMGNCAVAIPTCINIACYGAALFAPGTYTGEFDGDPCIQGYLYFGDGGIITVNSVFAGTANAYGYRWHWEGLFLENPCFPGPRTSVVQFGADRIVT